MPAPRPTNRDSLGPSYPGSGECPNRSVLLPGSVRFHGSTPTVLAVVPGTLVAAARTLVAVASTVVAVAWGLMAMASTVVVMLMPGAIVAVMAVVSMVVMPGTVVAMAAVVVVVRNEDEGVRGKAVPVTVSAVPAAGMLPMAVMSASPRIVQHPVEGPRGNPEENRLAGREAVAVPATVTLSLPGERRLDAEREHCEQGRGQGR